MTLLNAFLADKIQTMRMTGGNTETLYQGDGRLKMANALARLWPGVVEVRRKFKRPQHHIIGTWGRFKTPLRLKPGVDLGKLSIKESDLVLSAYTGPRRGDGT